MSFSVRIVRWIGRSDCLRAAIIAALVLSQCGGTVAGESSVWQQFREEWRTRRIGNRAVALAGLLNEVRTQRGVLCSGDTMTFFYLVPGTKRLPRVEIAGDFTGWGPPARMERLPDSRLFSYTLTGLPADARLEYKFRMGEIERLDPLNPRTVPNGMGGTNSVATMPGYRALDLPDLAVSKLAGRLESHDFSSRIARNTRRVTVYLPPGYRRDRRPSPAYPTVYVHDGGSYLRYARAAVIVDRLVTQGRIVAPIVVFVDPINRWKEYDQDPTFTRIFVEELVPFIDSRYRTAPEPGKRLVLGASMGGLIAMHLAFSHPGVFGLVASQSGAFHHLRPGPVADISRLPRSPIRVYADVGLYDLRDSGMCLLDESRKLRRVLEARGYSLLYREYAGGHNYTSWADQLPSILEHFFVVRSDRR